MALPQPTPVPAAGRSQAELYAVAERVLPGAGLGGYSLPADGRFVIAAAQGARLVSADGRDYIDYVGGAGANILGANHPAVVEAVQKAAADGLHFFGTLNVRAIELAERLVDIIPCADQVVLTTTGSEATAYILRIARAFTGRDKILKFEGAYHGNHDYASVSQFPTAAATYPSGRADSGGVPAALAQTMMVAPYNDLAVVERILAAHRDEIAGIIVEPVQRVIFARPGFLQGLRDLADKYGVLLIFDEVVTGFRLALGGAQQHFGVTPDLASFGKIVGGGGPLGCVAGRKDILDKTNPRHKGRPDYAYVNGTLHGNPLAAAAGMATLDLLQAPDFYRDFHARADAFTARAQAVLDTHGLPARISGGHSFWQVLFADRDPVTQMDVLASDLERSKALDLALLRGGVYVLPTVRRFFSAVHTEADVALTLAVLDRACATV